jgi:hypothetical protein
MRVSVRMWVCGCLCVYVWVCPHLHSHVHMNRQNYTWTQRREATNASNFIRAYTMWGCALEQHSSLRG